MSDNVMNDMDFLDGWDFFHLWSDQCCRCRHKTPTPRHTCAAFPQGIPRPIRLGEFDHHEPWPDDQGIRFEKHERANAGGRP